jgi:hypothetical protein
MIEEVLVLQSDTLTNGNDDNHVVPQREWNEAQT